MRPNELVVRAYLFRGVKLWLVTRAALSGAFALGGEDPLRLSASAIAGVICLTVVLGYLDIRFRRESVFLGNLGISQGVFGGMFAGPALAGELILQACTVLFA